MKLPALFSRLSVRTQLTLLVLVALLPAVFGMAWLIGVDDVYRREEVNARLKTMATQMAIDIEREIRDYAQAMEQIAARPRVQAQQPNQCDTVLADLAYLDPKLIVVSIRDTQGNPVCLQTTGKPVSAAQIAAAPWFQQALRAGTFHVSPPLVGPLTGRDVVIMSYPLRDAAGRLTGVLGLSLDLQLFQEKLLGARSANTSMVAVAFDDAYRVMLDSSQPANVGKTLPPGRLRDVHTKRAPYFSAPDDQGVPYLWAHVDLPGTMSGWHLVAGQPEAEAFASQRKVLAGSAALLAATLALVIVMASLVTRPLLRLARASAQIDGWSGSSHLAAEGSPEILALANRFNRLLDEQRSVSKELDSILRAIPDLLLQVDGQLRILKIWTVEPEILPMSKEALMGRCLSDILPPKAAKETATAVAEAWLNGRSYGRKVYLVTPLGKRWFELSVAPMAEASDMAGAHYILVGRDVTARTQADHARVRAEARFSEAERLAHIGSWELDLSRDELHWSAEIYRIFEIDPARFEPSYAAFLELVHPDDRAALDAAYSEAVHLRATYSFEHRLLMPDGRIKWVSEHALTEYDTTGQPLRSIGTTQDITERKLAEEQVQAALRDKDVLLQEVYHRVKNNLQVVSSLLAMQGRSAGAESRALLQESANRVRSMALVHEQLYRSSDLSSIRLDSYVAQLVKYLAQAHRPASWRVTVLPQIDSTVVGIEIAIPIGLILTELISNAFKHGYPNDATGQIKVRIQRLDEDTVRLDVADDGRGLPAGFDPAQVNTLGMQLVMTLTRQLNGELTIGDGPGAVFLVALPLRQNPGA